MNYVEKLIAGKHIRIWWVGDYAQSATGTVNGMTVGEHMAAYTLAWDNALLDEADIYEQMKVKRNNKYKYLVNFSKEEYIDLERYDELFFDDTYRAALHPLPLLTCISNILGNGDYRGFLYPNKELVGSWAGDEIGLYTSVDKRSRYGGLWNCTEKYEFREI